MTWGNFSSLWKCRKTNKNVQINSKALISSEFILWNYLTVHSSLLILCCWQFEEFVITLFLFAVSYQAKSHSLANNLKGANHMHKELLSLCTKHLHFSTWWNFATNVWLRVTFEIYGIHFWLLSLAGY